MWNQSVRARGALDSIQANPVRLTPGLRTKVRERGQAWASDPFPSARGPRSGHLPAHLGLASDSAAALHSLHCAPVYTVEDDVF